MGSRLLPAWRLSVAALTLSLLSASAVAQDTKPKPLTKADYLQQIIANTKPLQHDRGQRLPLYAWIAMDVPGDDAALEKTLKDLDARGIAVMTSWNGSSDPKALEAALRVGRLQKKLGLRVNVFGGVFGMGGVVFNGDEKTAHVGDDGKPFFDRSQLSWVKAGCPFAMESQYPALIGQLEFFCKGYKDAGLKVDFMVADWEVDGPLEYNDGWAAARKCKVCREKIPGIAKFQEFQKVVRTLRGDMQKRVYADTLLKHFPQVLVGNYGIYPNDGWRYWYDFYEKVPADDSGVPFRKDGNARHRPWFAEWPLTGYTYGMPVVYPRYAMYDWYDFPSSDYRWFRGMLLNASNGAKCAWELNSSRAKRTSRPAVRIPTISFIKYHTCDKPDAKLPDVPNISEAAYKELLWHMLLRKTDAFINWCPDAESVKEVTLLQEVYAASLEYREFLDKGSPVSFDTPDKPGPVVSGLMLGGKLLLRRTDFTDTKAPVEIKVGGQTIAVPRADGKCQVVDLKKLAR